MDISKRLVEVEEVLNYLVEEEKEKIPQEVFNLIRENKDPDYVWKIDKSKTLAEQGLPNETLTFLSYINLEYLLSDEKRQLMEQFYKLNDVKAEKG